MIWGRTIRRSLAVLAIAPVPYLSPQGTLADEAGGQTEQDWNAHIQSTLTEQIHPTFPAAYSGPNSLAAGFQSRETISATAFLGVRPWTGAEIYVDPESAQGFGFSHTFGVAGFPNGEAQKGGFVHPIYYLARYYIRQSFGFGGGREWVADGENQLAGWRDVSRFSVTVGQMAATDFFDNNAYANDPRRDFTNWALWEGAAWDVPGNARGYTHGAVLELDQPGWAVRYGAFAIPAVFNGIETPIKTPASMSHDLEIEKGYAIDGHPGKTRLLGFYTNGPMGNYRDALALAAKGEDINAAMASTRVPGHEKFGVVLNLEQEVAEDLGAFTRLSWNNGRNEEWGYTDVDRSAQAGISLKGGRWGRKDDTIGIGTAVNAITQAHRDFLAAGGTTLLLGDGALDYGEETDVEAYYALAVAEPLTVTFDYQFINNPGYNQARGPVNVFGIRLHAEY